ncbi:hypothetical protein HPB50_026701 [Hyalomma asiaticum]|uniref:Uncharacterized protein n=1 Tax=Hyalomma asiaticum TaxID=266040 RepID=A0ACB7T4K8_HYAAI|nr:hypothetical protein HPB50_026701 [Hyalomma asiaticum]
MDRCLTRRYAADYVAAVSAPESVFSDLPNGDTTTDAQRQGESEWSCTDGLAPSRDINQQYGLERRAPEQFGARGSEPCGKPKMLAQSEESPAEANNVRIIAVRLSSRERLGSSWKVSDSSMVASRGIGAAPRTRGHQVPQSQSNEEIAGRKQCRLTRHRTLASVAATRPLTVVSYSCCC